MTQQPTVTIDFGTTIGAIKPLHGLNNGPVGFGTILDVSHRYREIGVPFVRLHDPNWPHPREVDIPQIFPDFDADPEDPASYYFGPTDDYIRSILATGARIIYRLGVSIEHNPRKRFTHPPADFKKWSRIALGIVRHYAEGWADGLRDAVDYWEIWNEPDIGANMWGGTFEQYLELYAEAATTIKQHHPDLQVGGYGAAFVQNEKLPQFLAFCRDRRLPLDFFSWHTYAKHPAEFVDNARFVRTQLDAHGFGKTESHLNEWNYVPPPLGWDALFGKDEHARRDAYERQKNEEGAAFVATTLMQMQDAPIDLMTYYDGQPMTWFCGLFDYYGVPQKTFLAFKGFHQLQRFPRRVATDCEVLGVAVLAARDDADAAAVLIANFGAFEGVISVQMKNISQRNVQVTLLDKQHDLQPDGMLTGARDEPSGSGEIRIRLEKFSFAMIRVGASGQ